MEAKSYAVKCSTEEQARELWRIFWANNFDERYIKWNIYFALWEYIRYLDINDEDLKDYTIITYEEAQEKGLLGEKKVCISCLGKKKNSIYKWDKVLQPDFIGDGRYLLEWEWITMVDCSRCKGTGLEPEYIPEVEPQQNEVQESTSEDNLVEKQIESIMKDIDRYWWVEVYTREWFKELLQKHLLSK